MLSVNERNKLSIAEFMQWRLVQEAAAFRQAYQFAIQGEQAVRQAGYTSVSHYVVNRRMTLEAAHKAWERANPV